jgi:hypothetical protein
MSLKQTLLCAAVVSVALAAPAAAQSALKSPKDVQQALGTLSRVVDHTQRLISNKNYVLLPGENNEFKEGSAALRETLAEQPSQLRSTVEPLLKKAGEDSQNIADAVASHDYTKLAQAHAALANSVKGILRAFPADVQPGQPSIAREKEEDAIRQQTLSSPSNVAKGKEEGPAGTTGSAR